MNDLIKTFKHETIEQAVSAKELYVGLGLHLANWKRWYFQNIENNKYFIENRDWVGFIVMMNGNETRDFAITIEFAKHIAMMANTDKSHDYRNHMIATELENVRLKDELHTKELAMLEKELELEEQRNKNLRGQLAWTEDRLDKEQETKRLYGWH